MKNMMTKDKQFTPSALSQEKLTAIYGELDRTVDGLGNTLDEGIKKTVAALWYRGFRTTASCEGHLEWGCPFPWIDMYHKDRYLNLILREQLDKLLVKFNHSGEEPKLVPLVTVDFGPHYGCRIQHYTDIKYDGVKNKPLLEFLQGEMNEFADFLMKEK